MAFLFSFSSEYNSANALYDSIMPLRLFKSSSTSSLFKLNSIDFTLSLVFLYAVAKLLYAEQSSCFRLRLSNSSIAESE